MVIQVVHWLIGVVQLVQFPSERILIIGGLCLESNDVGTFNFNRREIQYGVVDVIIVGNP